MHEMIGDEVRIHERGIRGMVGRKKKLSIG